MWVLATGLQARLHHVQCSGKHPRGYVVFANAAIGEIGSTQSVYPASPGTSQPATTTTTTTTTRATTTTSSSLGAWEPVDGGEGRACRGSSRGDNNPQYYQLAQGVMSLEDCQMRCAATAGCRGIEFSRQRCEVWVRPMGIQASIPLAGFTCMRYDGPLVSTTTPAAGTWLPVDGGDGRACRGASRVDNSPDYYTVVAGLVSLDACKAQCQAMTGCKGVEFKIGRCEVWTRPQGIGASIPLSGFTCLSYQSPASSTQSPSTATTTTTATTTEATTTVATTTAPATTAPTSCASAWQQCGGRNHAGPTCCVEGHRCVVDNEWYSQCQPEAAFAQAAAKKRGGRRSRFLGPSFMQSKAKTRSAASTSPTFEKWEL
ncbi:cel6A [Symbiodinium natans]|uniref:Cel6A protein n=1 Tax=Symbiodinium natans TaxID=878477 RepID=A0A812GFD5_9DINO|nr:cel6A [Symbiodinium natans]